MTNDKINPFEISERDIKTVTDLLVHFDPVAGKLYEHLFMERRERSSQMRSPMKRLARKLHTREENLSRARRTLRALGLINEEHSGKFGTTRITVRPYCASVLRLKFEECDGNLPLVLKAIYRHLKLHQDYLNDEYKIYSSVVTVKGADGKARKQSKSKVQAPVRHHEKKVLNLTPDVVEIPLPRYLPEAVRKAHFASSADVEPSYGQQAANVMQQRPALPQTSDKTGVDNSKQLLDCVYDSPNQAERPRTRWEVTQTAENCTQPIESTASCKQLSEISLLVNTNVFILTVVMVLKDQIRNKQIRGLYLQIYESYINFVEVTRGGNPESSLTTLSASEFFIYGHNAEAPDHHLSSLNQPCNLVLISSAGVAFFDDESGLVYSGGKWADYSAPQSLPGAAGRANEVRVVVGDDELVIRAGNAKKLQRLYNEWRTMSPYEATYMVWETYNDATRDIKTVYLMDIPQSVQDGQGRSHRQFMRAYNWVTGNWSRWGELWLRLLAGLETNAMLRGHGPQQLNIKSHPSFRWLFSNLNPASPDVRIDAFLAGKYRRSELNPDGSAKYDRVDWHKREAELKKEDRVEIFGNPDYGDVSF